jgi:maltose/moltooligosaccharide transporter
MSTKRPTLSTAAILNMSIGFFGIQFGWGLQMANMSAIYEHLGANADQIPILWLAAPMTGLLVQPIIGHMSDRTWGRLGRRRPYFLVGAILSALALLIMPVASALWTAAVLLWVLDASINISMEPFRAFVADLLPESQRTRGFAMQSLLIGLGAVMASSLPWLVTNVFGMHRSDVPGQIPSTVRLSFDLGALVFLSAVLWTVFTTKERPPEDMEAFRRMKAEHRGVMPAVREILECVRAMPGTMRELAWVQVFTWLGLFCMWLYFPVAVARNVFGANGESSPGYAEGVEWAGVCFAVYSAVCFVVSFFLPRVSDAIGRRTMHAICLALGAAGLISVAFIHDKHLLLLSMAGVGCAWASILSVPYAILAGALPEGKTGVYMGIFNFFIVLPEIIASVALGWVMSHLLGNNRVLAVAIGGGCMLTAALLTLRVRERSTTPHLVASPALGEGAAS